MVTAEEPVPLMPVAPKPAETEARTAESRAEEASTGERGAMGAAEKLMRDSRFSRLRGGRVAGRSWREMAVRRRSGRIRMGPPLARRGGETGEGHWTLVWVGKRARRAGEAWWGRLCDSSSRIPFRIF